MKRLVVLAAMLAAAPGCKRWGEISAEQNERRDRGTQLQDADVQLRRRTMRSLAIHRDPAPLKIKHD